MLIQASGKKRTTRESHWNVAEQKNCYCQNYTYMSNLEYLLELWKKVIGATIWPAVVLFKILCLEKQHVSCPVGLSGLCCHILTLLLFLKHYGDANEKNLELTCTEQLQKWQRRSKKGSISLAPFKQLKPKLAGMKIKQNKILQTRCSKHINLKEKLKK